MGLRRERRHAKQACNYRRLLGGSAASDASGTGLLTSAIVPVNGTALYRLVDRLNQSAMLGVDLGRVTIGGCGLEAVEVSLDT